MSWIDTLDRLITDSWAASRDESAVMLDSLLALSLAERWDLFVTRDTRLTFLSDEDYTTLFRSLDAHALMAKVADAHTPAPVSERVTGEDGEPVDTEAVEYEGDPDAVYHEEMPVEPVPSLQSRWRSRIGVRWLTVGVVAATGLALAGAFLAVVVLYMLPSGRSSQASQPSLLIGKLDEIERDQSLLAKRIARIDGKVDDLAVTVENRFGTAMRAVHFASAFDLLSAAIDRGVPFSAELARLAPAVAEKDSLTAPLKRLETLAKIGVPTPAALRERYDEMAPKLLGVIDSRDQLAPRVTETGFFGWVGSLFGTVDSVEAKRFRATLVGIHATLSLGNLASAIQQLEELHAYPAEPVTRWLSAAHLRLEAENAAAALRLGILPGPVALTDK
ncbi:MAG: hypothetical protein WCF85_05280 [Rhodospirillaceae bacterium]